MSNDIPILAGQDWIKFSTKYLGTEKALVWVGGGSDPLDNDDALVQQERDLMRKRYPHVPSGMAVGNPVSDQRPLMESEMRPLADADNDGYYKLDTSRWPAGVYRLNYHSLPGEQAAHGSPLHPEKRDQDVSWALWNQADQASLEAIRPFVHENQNGTGQCFRLLIASDRHIAPFG